MTLLLTRLFIRKINFVYLLLHSFLIFLYSAKFPNATDFVSYAHSLNVNVIMWATSVVNPDCPIYKEGKEKGYFLNSGELVKVRCCVRTTFFKTNFFFICKQTSISGGTEKALLLITRSRTQ